MRACVCVCVCVCVWLIVQFLKLRDYRRSVARALCFALVVESLANMGNSFNGAKPRRKPAGS
jgi:hypothetical protein